MTEGREEKKSNDLFYTCSLIERISEITKNKPADVVAYLGGKTLEKIYDLADVYHCESIDSVSEDFIEEKRIPPGSFDPISECRYSVPTCWDIGKVYKRLILMAEAQEHNGIIKTLQKVYASRVSDLIEDYNGSFYYENPSVIYETYCNNGIPE